MKSVLPVKTDEPLSLEYLLTIWPVVESLATCLPVGDLITLSRTNKVLRAGLHGESIRQDAQTHSDGDEGFSYLIPHIGEHQTSYWKHLKSQSPFTCVNKVHTKGQKLKPCVYCSRPICDACIVRDSFKKGKEDTFKNRLRYFCRECWTDGKRTKTYRYSVSLQYRGPDILGDDQTTVDTDSFCNCTLKDNGWLCIECKEWQNTFGASSTKGSSLPLQSAQCHAIDCQNIVDLSSSLRDRQRICLWCQKPLRRQYGGEDRHAWNQKTITERAIKAESQSRDIEEYSRKRWRSLRMSRNEMRGTTIRSRPEDDKLEFVRHLDTVNYLGTHHQLSQKENPSPDAVYKSKNGIWKYERDFLLAFDKICRYKLFRVPNLDAQALQDITKEGASRFARTNATLRNDLYILRGRKNKLVVPMQKIDQWTTLQTRIADLMVDLDRQGQGVELICAILADEYDLNLNARAFKRLWDEWNARNKSADDDGTVDGQGENQSSGEGVDIDHENTPTSPDPDVENEADIDNPIPTTTPANPLEDVTTVPNTNTSGSEAESSPIEAESVPPTTNANNDVNDNGNEETITTSADPDMTIRNVPSPDEPPSYLP